jgi:uncharacterized protein (TIGR00251 family)
MLFKLKVHPASKKAAILKKGSDAYEIWVRAKAERGMANRETIKILAAELKIEEKLIHIVKGSTSPSKIVKVYET